ncbi:hypothetical protein [Rubritalea tangerina]
MSVWPAESMVKRVTVVETINNVLKAVFVLSGAYLYDLEGAAMGYVCATLFCFLLQLVLYSRFYNGAVVCDLFTRHWLSYCVLLFGFVAAYWASDLIGTVFCFLISGVYLFTQKEVIGRCVEGNSKVEGLFKRLKLI